MSQYSSRRKSLRSPSLSAALGFVPPVGWPDPASISSNYRFRCIDLPPSKTIMILAFQVSRQRGFKRCGQALLPRGPSGSCRKELYEKSTSSIGSHYGCMCFHRSYPSSNPSRSRGQSQRKSSACFQWHHRWLGDHLSYPGCERKPLWGQCVGRVYG